MTDRAFQPELDFEAAEQAAKAGEALIVDLDGYEGPLHLLLSLARSQKVDLSRLSISVLADQYLAYVKAARQRRFALAADYLVMAAWLTFLKSKLLLPRPERATTDEGPGQEMAEALTFRLAKLDAMRGAAEALRAAPQLGRDVFVRGDPEAAVVQGRPRFEGDLFQLMAAYVDQRRRREARTYTAAARVEAYPLEAARERLRRMLPGLSSWTPLRRVVPEASSQTAGQTAGQTGGGHGPTPASHLASTFAAGLEMVKEGSLEVRQLEAFADLYLKARIVGAETADAAGRAA